jgi:hypothetical protein
MRSRSGTILRHGERKACEREKDSVFGARIFEKNYVRYLLSGYGAGFMGLHN